MQNPDVVVVGAGIAGGAIATALARGGLEVVVLERTLQHEDRVRGEYMHPWGVAEVQRLGLYDELLAAGATVLQRVVLFDELRTPAEAEAHALALNLLPGVEGPLSIGHPTACDAMDAAAVSAGATLVRGVADVRVTPGSSPTITYQLDGADTTISPRIVIGADGRESTIRKQLGVDLHATEARTIGAGMLVAGVDGLPSRDAVIGTEGEWHFLVFPQTGGRARLYLFHDISLKNRLVGRDKARTFLEAFRLRCFPAGEAIAAASPAGPCGAFPMTDTWVDVPVVDGVVLIGDAAGWSDPFIGEGLSIAMRDARMVSEVLLGGDWSPGAFGDYVRERAERMRRLRFGADILTTQGCELVPDRLERRRRAEARLSSDPELVLVRAMLFVGPEIAPAHLCTAETKERIFAS
jgi:2-polyprenyl-6-methoxyphenol hydroxylase-like FAD-dependent oxidoreductase